MKTKICSVKVSTYENISSSGSDTIINDGSLSAQEEDESEVTPSDQEWVDVNSANDILRPPFEFAENCGVLDIMNNFKKEYEYFNYFFDENLLKIIADQTNLFAEQFIRANTHSSTSLYVLGNQHLKMKCESFSLLFW